MHISSDTGERIYSDLEQRDRDAIEDDLARLRMCKRDLIDLLTIVRRHVDKESFDKYAIGVEQCFDDLIHDTVADLTEEGSMDANMPISPWHADWLKEQLHLRQPTNPRTYADKEVPL